MLPKNSRLNLKYHFKWVASGKRVESNNFKFFIKTSENDKPLIGVAVSAKTFKKSSQRIQAKRISFKAIESLYDGLPKDMNLVIMPKGNILAKSVEELAEELKNVEFNS